AGWVGIPAEPSEEPPRYALPRSRQALDVGQIYSSHVRFCCSPGKYPRPPGNRSLSLSSTWHQKSETGSRRRQKTDAGQNRKSQKHRLGDLRSRLCDLAFRLLKRRPRPTI